jgi:hypothetical protein
VSKQSDQFAYDKMVAELREAGLSGRDLDYAIDMVMVAYKHLAKLSVDGKPPEASKETRAMVEHDLTSRGLKRLIRPVIAATPNYVNAIQAGNRNG